MMRRAREGEGPHVSLGIGLRRIDQREVGVLAGLEGEVGAGRVEPEGHRALGDLLAVREGEGVLGHQASCGTSAGDSGCVAGPRRTTTSGPKPEARYGQSQPFSLAFQWTSQPRWGQTLLMACSTPPWSR